MTPLHAIARETAEKISATIHPIGPGLTLYYQQQIESACLSAVEQAMQELKQDALNSGPVGSSHGVSVVKIDAMLARWRQEQP